MAYSADIDSLNPNARYPFSSDANDTRPGSLDGTVVGPTFSEVGICLDVTNGMTTANIDDYVVLPPGGLRFTDRKAVSGWFLTTAIQNPPKSIYGDGGSDSTSLRFILGWGNYLVFELFDGVNSFQIFSDYPLEINRPYHLTLVFEGSGNGNIIKGYIDGVEQFYAEPPNKRHDVLELRDRHTNVFGAPLTPCTIGGTIVSLLAPINGVYNQWAFWKGGEAELSGTQIKEVLFEKGALAETTVTNQTELNALNNSVRGNYPVSIRVDVAGDIQLGATDILFSSGISVHVQYTGTGTLTWFQYGTSNASKISTPNGGTIVISTVNTFKINVKDAATLQGIPNARILAKETDGLLRTIANTTDAQGILSFDYGYTQDQIIEIRIRRASDGTYYKASFTTLPITNNDTEVTILMVGDE